jgi:hypothetical protein
LVLIDGCGGGFNDGGGDSANGDCCDFGHVDCLDLDFRTAIICCLLSPQEYKYTAEQDILALGQQ